MTDEPRGCPTPGACSCVDALAAAIERAERAERERDRWMKRNAFLEENNRIALGMGIGFIDRDARLQAELSRLREENERLQGHYSELIQRRDEVAELENENARLRAAPGTNVSSAPETGDSN
jgi:predicted nuclease with TOPRIM domain